MKFYNFLLLLFTLSIYSQPNVIIILTDDLGWGDVSYHGGFIPTPNIDKFVSNGVELNRFYANPTCSPTRASLLTGLHVFNHGVIRPFMNPSAEQTGLPEHLKIMPEYFKDAGYQTALSGKWHLGMHKEEYLPTNRGFDSSYGHMLGGIGYYDHVHTNRMDWHRDGVSLSEDGYSTELIADEAINIIENKDDDRPLFLYVAFNAPHTPIEAPEEDINNFLYIEDELDRNYAANISKLDIEIGRIINSISDLGMLEETIIIFLSDNGPVFDINPIVKTIAPGLTKSKGSTAGLRGSKTSALDGGIRVPAAIWWKGVLEKSKTDQFIFIQDLLPTLLTATGISYKEEFLIDGVDRWTNLLTNKISAPVNAFVGNKIIFDERALFNNDWKLYYKKPVMFDVEGTFKLFNIVNDPYEKEDLSTTELNIFNEMKDTLMNIEELNSIGIIDPVHAYLHGDTEGGGVIGSPWLDRDYELNQPVSKTAGFFIMMWVLIQSFKYQLIGLLLFFVICRFAYKRYKVR